MRYFLFLAILCGCASQFAALQGGSRTQDIALEELRVELGDIKHAMHAQQVEMRLLEEKLDQEGGVHLHDLQDTLALIERKISTLEKSQEKVSFDLNRLSSHANQTSASLTQYRDQILELDRRLDEALRLKSTLASLSKAIEQKQPSSASKSYRVKSGDSLEKIAKRHNTSVQSLKELNRLSSDRIVVGQELHVPSE